MDNTIFFCQIKKELFMMSVRSNNNIQEIVTYSAQIHENQINRIKKYLNKEKTDYQKWCEFLYSILVGTQIKTDRAKLCYNKLLDEYFDLLNPIFLNDSNNYSNLKEHIEISLKSNGYRFYKSKSETIYNSILFFKKYSFKIGDFLSQYNDFQSIRKELMKIRGIGYKIASHWLRNMGFYIPVIDIHIKNMLYNFNIISNKNFDYSEYEKIQNKLINELDVDNITFDLALWYYGKNYCGNPHRCSECKFNHSCRSY